MFLSDLLPQPTAPPSWFTQVKGVDDVTFKVGQKVVYPNHGVSLVEKIEPGQIDGVAQVYFHLKLLGNNSRVMVPKTNLELVGLRPLCQQREVRALFDILEDGNIDTYKDWKGRYKQNLDKMKTGQLVEVAEVLKNLRLVSQRKSLSFREKKMYERAKYFIVSEVAHVKNITERESEDLVERALSSSLEKRQRAKAS
jgi:CarD family transcriptional regulator